MAQRCDRRRRLSLALIAIVSNAGYTTIAPILPLEIDTRGIPPRWVSLIFLAFSVGSSVAPPAVARHLESVGTIKIMAWSMAGMSVLFWGLGHVFDFTAEGVTIVGILTLLQFLMGVFFSAISTGYYSLATSIFADKESAMSTVEASVGVGYILGPILGSMVYDEMGYRAAYASISLGMMAMAFATWRWIAPVLKCEAPAYGCDDDDDNDDEMLMDLEEQRNAIANYNSMETGVRARSKEPIVRQPMETNAPEETREEEYQGPSALSLLKHPTILIAASTILWVNVAWTFLEPLLAKRLDNFRVGKKEIGMIFSLSNVVYVPAVYLVQYFPRKHAGRHRTIALSTALTPVAVLLAGSNHLTMVVVGIALLGLLPTPVWIMLLPFLQEESTARFPDPSAERQVNDVTAGVYNSFMTLGQVAGYIIGPLLGSYSFALTTRVVAVLIFSQSLAFYFGTDGFHPRRKEGVLR